MTVLPLNAPSHFTPLFAPHFFLSLCPHGLVGINLCTYCSPRGLVGISGDYDVIAIAQFLKIAHILSFLQIWYIFRIIFEASHF